MSLSPTPDSFAEPDDVKQILPASLGTPLRTETIRLSRTSQRDPDKSVHLEYMMHSQNAFECLRWRLAHIKDPEACEAAFARYVHGTREFFLIPGPLECDRVFLRDRCDAVYVEAAARYLRGESSIQPILSEGAWKYPTVGSLQSRERARNLAVGAAEASLYYDRIISLPDWVTFCLQSIQGILTEPGEDGMMLISHVMFPKMPKTLSEINPCPHIPVKETKIGYYFCGIASDSDRYFGNSMTWHRGSATCRG